MADAIKVLHVDGDPPPATPTSARLERENPHLDVVTETRVADGLATLSSRVFDCVVSDYRVADRTGLQFLRAVREQYGDLPFILFTDSGSEEIASEAISAGVSNYLPRRPGVGSYDTLAQQIQTTVERERAVQRFETFLEAIPDSVLIAGQDGNIESINRRTEELFGYDSEELLGSPIEMLIPERFRDDHREFRAEYVESPESRPMGADVDLYGLRADGTEFPVDVAISPIYVGDRMELIAAVRDISTRKWREEQLREREAELEAQNERLEAFAGVVSHDLRNPLNLATGKLDLARAECDSPHLEQVARAHERMESMITDLLTIAREGERTTEVGPTDLAATADDCWETVETADASLVVAANATIRADEGRLRQLLENLLRNAVEHGGSDVTVTVGELPDGFFVEDDGVGIPATIRAQVFESGYTSSREGAGLGLAIVERVADGHGWDVTATESDAAGGRFEVTGVDCC